jgi:hypothetical protein
MSAAVSAVVPQSQPDVHAAIITQPVLRRPLCRSVELDLLVMAAAHGNARGTLPPCTQDRQAPCGLPLLLSVVQRHATVHSARACSRLMAA